MLQEDEQNEEIIARVAALDIGKAELVCCVRIPHEGRPGRRLQEVATYSTMTRSLLRMADRLAELEVTRVVMEATSDYWKPVYYLLEAHGFETWLVNARADHPDDIPGHDYTPYYGKSTFRSRFPLTVRTSAGHPGPDAALLFVGPRKS